MIMSDLIDAVERRFAELAVGLQPWPAPRGPHESARKDEYSRVSDPEKYRLLKARVDAWVSVLGEMAEIEESRSAEGLLQANAPDGSASLRLRPRSGAVPIVVREITMTDEAYGVELAVGDPAEFWAFVPDCGCDACDHGWFDLAEYLDEQILTILRGGTILVTDGVTTVQRYGDGASMSGSWNTNTSGWLDLVEQPDGLTVVRGDAWI